MMVLMKPKKFQQGFAIVPVIILVALVGLMVPTVKYVTDPEASFDNRGFARVVGPMIDGVGSVTSVLNKPKTTTNKESAADITQRIQEKFNQKQEERKQKEKKEEKEEEAPASAQRYQGLADNWQDIEQKIEEQNEKEVAQQSQADNQSSQDNVGQLSLADYLPLDDLKAIQESGVDVGELDKQMKLSAEQRQIIPVTVDENESDEEISPEDNGLSPTQDQQKAKDKESCQAADGYWSGSKCLGYGEVNSGFTWCPSGEGRGISYSHWFEGGDCEPKNNRPNSQDSCTVNQGYWSGSNCILPGETNKSGDKTYVWCQAMEGEGHYPYPHWFEGDGCGVVGEEIIETVVVTETPIVEEIIELEIEPPTGDEACISSGFCSSLGGAVSGDCGCENGEICCNLGTENTEDYFCNPGQSKSTGGVNLICDQSRTWIKNPLPLVDCQGDECIPAVIEEATLVAEEVTDAVCAPAMVCSVEGGAVVSVEDCPGSQVKCNFPESQVEYIGKPTYQGSEIITLEEEPFSVEDLTITGKTEGEFCFTNNQCGGGLECNLFQCKVPVVATSIETDNDLLMSAAVGPGGVTLSEDYEPENLVSLGNAVPSAFHNAWHDPEIREEAVEYIQAWTEAIFRELGAVPYFTYGYRSYELQDELHQGNPNGAYEAGHSQHQNGLAFDVPQFVTTENGQLVWHKACTTRGRKECEVAVRAIEIAQEYGIAHPLDWDGPHFFVAAAVSNELGEFIQSIEDPVSTSYYVELNEEIIKLQNENEQASEASMKGN